ncbi:MAG TPA: NADH-quinone oxidoreductase subunit NuoK, partial [Prevotella sp.]
TRRNLVAMLISIELVLKSVDINFAVFNRLLYPGQLEGFFFTLFSIGVSAAETAVALAIIINVYRNFKSDQVNTIEELKN